MEQTEERLKRLERQVRDLQVALERNRVLVESLAAESRSETSKLSAWLKATSQSVEEIAQSRIWRTLALLAKPFVPSSPPRTAPQLQVGSYRQWMESFEWRDAALIEKRLAEFSYRPRISLIAAYGDSPRPMVERSVQSLLAQSYPNWEVCLAGSGAGHTLSTESRIRVRRRESDPWRAALQLASGDFVAALGAGAMLNADALFHIVDLLNREPVTDVIYCDEDRMDARGQRDNPFFKPDWSPDLILSMNYTGGLTVVRRELVAPDAVSGDYDMLLRTIEQTSRIRHLPRVLLHEAVDAPQRDLAADRRVVDEHLRRAHPGAWTELDRESGRWRVRYPAPLDGRVSIIIPSGGKVDLLEANLTDLFEKTDYSRYDVVLVDNSQGDAVKELVGRYAAIARPIRHVDRRRRPFNFASLCNAAVETCDAPFLLFLNDDTRVVSSGWLQAMVELAARPEVGVVGARLQFPDGTLQHAGITLGLYGRSGHLFKGLDASVSHYFGFDRVIRNVSAVTGACLMIRAEVFREIGGFDQDHFPVDANDVDLCLRAGVRGYRVLYTPFAELLHYESMSKGPLDQHAHPGEVQAFAQRWADVIKNDPFYSPNLTRVHIDCSSRKSGE